MGRSGVPATTEEDGFRLSGPLLGAPCRAVSVSVHLYRIQSKGLATGVTAAGLLSQRV